jgi:hypothetical protein
MVLQNSISDTTVEAITAQFQNAAFQCPDSIPKRRLCLAFVNAVHEPLRKKCMPGYATSSIKLDIS